MATQIKRTPGAGARSLGRRRVDESRRQELLAQLEEIFLAEGFSGFTADDICRRLHCSKTTLYSIAETKEQIVQAVTRRFFSMATAQIEEAVAAEPIPPAASSPISTGSARRCAVTPPSSTSTWSTTSPPPRSTA